MNLFRHLNKPDSGLFFIKNDKNDPRLGETVLSEEKDYEKADFIILGSPQDEGVKRNNGRSGAAEAPDLIRKEFYKFPAQEKLTGLNIFDAGNIQVSGTLEEIHTIQKNIIKRIIDDGKKLIILGGGNDISYPDCSALSESSNKNLIAFNIDSHFDVRESGERNSGTPYRQLLDEGFIDPVKFFQIANKPYTNSDFYKNYLEKKGVLIYTLESVRDSGIKNLLNNIVAVQEPENIFWGFDMDSVRSSDAPGVSATYPVGLSAEEACEIASIAGVFNSSKIFEISEVNPKYDIDSRTCKLAAILMLHFLLAQN